MIELRHLTKEYSTTKSLTDVNAVINKGDVISVIGPSGAGKSTLLRCINMLETPTGGDVLLDGEVITEKNYDLDKMRMKVGMIFQSFNLFQHLTVIENIMNPQIKLLKRKRQEAYDKAIDLLITVGLADKQFSYPDELSGGQKQRVAIARALAMDPEIILFDEPTSALDPNMVGEVQTVIRKLAATGTTMMIVTHDMNFARSICNRVFYMDEGRIYEDGTPEQIFLNPQREKTKHFVNNLSIFEAKIDSKNFDLPKIMADIQQFGNRQQFAPKVINNMQMAFEQLCVSYLINGNKNNIHLSVLFEYSEKKNELYMIVKHNGKQIPQQAFEQKKALKNLTSVSTSITQEAINDESRLYINKIMLAFERNM